MLRMKQGWESRDIVWPDGQVNSIIGRDGFASTDSPGGHFVTIMGGHVEAWPHGGVDGYAYMDTIEQAHEHLLSVGSDSPWEHAQDSE